MDLQAAISKAFIKAEKVAENRPFELKHLFTEVEWSAISRGDRVSLGKLFSNQVKLNRLTNIYFYGKAANNHNLYIKRCEK